MINQKMNFAAPFHGFNIQGYPEEKHLSSHETPTLSVRDEIDMFELWLQGNYKTVQLILAENKMILFQCNDNVC